MNTIEEVTGVAGRSRRRHSEEFKASVVQACERPGLSMAAVAMAHGLNANLLRRWVVERRAADVGTKTVGVKQSTGSAQVGLSGQFVPVRLQPEQAALPASDIRIELRRGATAMSISWPTAAASDCAAWMRELLK